MKKVVSLILVLLTFMQALAFEAAAKTYDADGAKRLLVGLEIMRKYDFEEGEELTRSDFALLAVKAMNKAQETAQVSGNKFSDVSADDENASEIYYLDRLDVMVGDGKGQFHPYDKLSMQDAVKAVVTMLNYGAQAKSRGGYPNGYMSIASELGLTKGMNKDTKAVLTAEEAMILLANALNTEMLQEIFEADRIVYKTVEGETLLYKAFDCIKGEGIVTANDKTTLEIEKKSAAGTVMIGSDVFGQGETDIDKMLGYYVEYYAYEPQGSGERVIVAYEIPERKNEILEIPSADITDETTEDNFVYELGNKVKNAKIAPAADIIYNGTAKQGIQKWHLTPDSGKVTLFDTDKDGIYDLVKVDSYINYVVDKAVQGNYIVDKYAQKAIDLDSETWEKITISLSGKEISASQLKEWDVLSVKADAEKIDDKGFREIDFDNAKYIEIYVSRNEISGRVNGVDKTENTVTIGSEEYYYSENLIKASKSDDVEFQFPSGGEGLSIVLDITGMAAGVKISGFAKTEYGFLVKTIIDKDEEPSAVYLKIYTGADGIKTYECKEKFRLDGESGSRAVWADELVGKPQLISFKTNSEGLVSEVDTGEYKAAYEKKDTSLQHDAYYKDIKYKSTAKVFHTTGTYESLALYINGNVKTFRVPSKTDILNNNYSENDFEILTANYFQDNKRYEMDAYNLSDTLCPELLVVYVDNSISTTVSSNAKKVMIDKLSMELDNYDEETVFLTGYYRGDPVSYSFKKEELMDKYKDENGNLTIKRGDVVLIDANDKNEITAMSEERAFSDNLGDKHSYGGTVEAKQLSFGSAYAKDSGAVVLRIDAEKAGIKEELYNVYPISATKKVTLYDATTNRVSVITVADILCEKDVGSEKAYLLMVHAGQDGQAKDFIAYKMK